MEKFMKFAIFDMDGTLVDSTRAICDTIRYMRAHMGFGGTLSDEFIMTAINDPRLDWRRELYGECEITPAIRELFEVKFRENYLKSAVLYDGIDAMLRALQGEGVRIALATNAPDAMVCDVLAHLGVRELFDIIIGSSANVAYKPDPAMVHLCNQRACELFGVDLAALRPVYIGNSNKDKWACERAGVPYINAIWDIGAPEGECLYNASTPAQAFEIAMRLFEA